MQEIIAPVQLIFSGKSAGMTFFQDQQQARRRTGILVLLYLLAVVCIVCFIYVGLLFAFGIVGVEDEMATASLWNPEMFAGTAIFVVGVIVLGTLYRVLQLAKGGIAVAHALGGRLIQYDSTDPTERKILNVVEEVAIAAGTRIPQVYLMEDEPGINAFAAGYKPNSAVIGVSRGCLTYLNRSELQGVIAHEFSHILNGDMRLNIRLMGVLHGILMLTLLGRTLVRTGLRPRYHHRRDNDMSGGLVAIGGVFLVVGSIGVLSAKLIKMAVSRQREFLADASAVQFTRDPDGIAGALLKIGGLQAGSALNSPRAEDISHLCFSNALAGFFSAMSLFSTHPPLELRIKKIKPRFNGTFPPVEPVVVEQIAEADSTTSEPAKPDLVDAILRPDTILHSVGMLSASAMKTSHALIAEIPNSLQTTVHTPLDAGAAVCALLLSSDPIVRKKQDELIQHQLPGAMYEQLPHLASMVASVPLRQRLPLLDMSLLSLRNLSKSQYLQLRLGLESLIHADGTLEIFEYALFQILTRTLDEHFGISRAAVRETSDLAKLVLPASRLLFALAHLGTDDTATANNAYTVACDTLGIDAKLRLSAEERSEISVTFLDTALQPLENISPLVQEKIFNSCVTCVGHDGRVSLAEAELLRAIGETLGCPVPLFSDLEQAEAS